jgi:hypothetical protein
MIFPGKRSPVGESVTDGKLTFTDAQAAMDNSTMLTTAMRHFVEIVIDSLFFDRPWRLHGSGHRFINRE